jgi:hypothetical protein
MMGISIVDGLLIVLYLWLPFWVGGDLAKIILSVREFASRASDNWRQYVSLSLSTVSLMAGLMLMVGIWSKAIHIALENQSSLYMFYAAVLVLVQITLMVMTHMAKTKKAADTVAP